MGTTEGGVLSGHDILVSPLSQFLVQAIIVILLTRLLAVGLYYVGQPRVIAEVIGGIILGPSVCGNIPGFSDRVFPKPLSKLALIANIGLVLYLFLVGIEIDPVAMAANVRKTAMVSLAGVVIPFVLGFLVSPMLYERMIKDVPDYGQVSMSSFTVFVCVAISITAFPVLARILNETNVLSTLVGNTAIGAAAVDDVIAWSLLALSIALINATNPATAAYIFLSVVAYAIGVIFIVRPAWIKLVTAVDKSSSHALSMSLMALTFLCVFFSAWVTEILGVHAIFGAFLFGLTMPRGHVFTHTVTERIEDMVQIVFLPLYFTLSGLNTDIGTIKGSKDCLVLVVVVLTAIAAKFLGCTFGAKLTGLPWRESAAVGVLMNTRGLVELIVLNIGLEARVITPKLFTIMVLMAIITTVMTTPLVNLIYPPSVRTYLKKDQGAPSKQTIKGPNDVDVIMVVNKLEEVPPLTAIMHMLKPGAPGANLLISGTHLVESSIATTDVLTARERGSNVDNLPTSLQMLSMVGSVLGCKVDVDVVVGTSRVFSDEIVRMASEHESHLTIVPYGQGKMYFLGDSYESFLEELVERISSPLVLLVNPVGSTVHNLTSSAGAARNILVIISGQKSDLEVLALASRFISAPGQQATVRLLVLVPSDQPHDPQVTRAVQAFKANQQGNESEHMELEGNNLSQQTVFEYCVAKNWDFIIVGSATFELSSTTDANSPVAESRYRSATESRYRSFELPVWMSGGGGEAAATSPRARRNTRTQQYRQSVLGTVGNTLVEGEAKSSLLIVHTKAGGSPSSVPIMMPPPKAVVASSSPVGEKL